MLCRRGAQDQAQGRQLGSLRAREDEKPTSNEALQRCREVQGEANVRAGGAAKEGPDGMRVTCFALDMISNSYREHRTSDQIYGRNL